MKNKLFIIIIVCAKLFAAEQLQNSFVSGLKEGFEKLGVTNSFNEFSVLIGTAFVPAVVTNSSCFSAGVQKADELLLDNLSNDSGIEFQNLEIKPYAWKRALIRQYFRRLITESFARTNFALVRGGWEFPALSYDWGIIEKIKKDGAVYGKVNGKVSRLVSAPGRLLILSVSNNFDLVRQKNKILFSAVKLLNNINSNDKLVTGIGALEYFANLTHRQPFCFECKKASSVCAEKFIKKYYEDLSQGLNFLKSIKDKNEDLTNAAKEIFIILKELRDITVLSRNLESQSKLGDKIRKLNANQRRAAAYLALYCGVPGPTTMPAPEFYRGNEKKILAKSLPLFIDMEDGKDTFLCSTILAGQVAGIERNLNWIKFCSTIPFKFLINRKTFMPPENILMGIDCSEKLFDSMGYDFVKYICPAKSREDVGDFIKQKIKESINRGYPLIISSTNGWGILAGYSGNHFICRFPDDSKNKFTYLKNISGKIFAFGEKKNEINSRERVKFALRGILKMSELKNAGKFVSGLTGLQYWIDNCSFYSDKKIYPVGDFAVANYELWTKLLKDKRDAYRSIDFIIKRFPELSIVFGFVKENYLEEVNILKCGLVDDIVLNFKKGIFTKQNWLPENAKKQISALKKIKKLEEENLLHFKIALRQLEMRNRY